jgi:hypothetical protein
MLMIGHAFTVCIRTENQNQMPGVSVGWPSSSIVFAAAVPCTELLQAVFYTRPLQALRVVRLVLLQTRLSPRRRLFLKPAALL